jgi:hypothetical protein
MHVHRLRRRSAVALVLVTDYQGPDDAYGAGRMAGHAVLDGIRAAERLGSTGLAGSATPVGMWGYSGGGLATGWAAELQPSYAPELQVRGVASGGTPADLKAAAATIDGGPFSGCSWRRPSASAASTPRCSRS